MPCHYLGERLPLSLSSIQFPYIASLQGEVSPSEQHPWGGGDMSYILYVLRFSQSHSLWGEKGSMRDSDFNKIRF